MNAAESLRAYTDGRGAYRPRRIGIVRGEDIAGDLELRADVVVIGSGAGGAPAAKELAEGGMRVIVVEDGDQHSTEELTARPRDELPRLYREAGQTATLGTPPIMLLLGRGLGGTTFVNSGTCFRTPASVLDRWRDGFGFDPGDMTPWFERVEREINVVQVPSEIAGRNALLAKRGADALGWSGGFLRRNVRGCVGSGVCAFGCPTSAKQHMGITYVPKAWDAGATTYTRTRARRIVTEGRRATAVVATTAAGGRLRIRAEYFVVSAGTIHTPLLLAKGGLGRRSGQLGRNLSIHPATAVWALFDERVDIARGVPQAYYVDEFDDEGIMFEGIGGPPDYVALATPFIGERQHELMLQYSHLAQLGLMVCDRSRGRVARALGRPVIRYDLGDRDVATFKLGLERLVELWWAAGARSVLLPVAGLPELSRNHGAPLRNLRLRARDLKLMAFHPLGTARAGVDPDRTVVDEDLRVHCTDNVWVSDGSVVPSSLGVNPQETIMALATRLAFHLLGRASPPAAERGAVDSTEVTCPS
jgi:choline dehydrogenase-like flavoprotein